MTTWKQKLGRRLRNSRFYPHIYFASSPFKIVEYARMREGISFRPDDLILDVGCGAGLQTLLFGMRAKQIIGIDPNPNAVGRAVSDHRECAPRIPAEFRTTTIENAGFPAGMFSKVFSVCVLEHIPNYRSALKECFRVLRPGGVLSISCDSLETIDDEGLKRMHAEQHHVEHLFTAESLKADLERMGFQNVQVYSIFRSGFARNLFMRAIRNNFQFRQSTSIGLSWLLRLTDFVTRSDPGLFLIARAVKPETGPQA